MCGEWSLGKVPQAGRGCLAGEAWSRDSARPSGSRACLLPAQASAASGGHSQASSRTVGMCESRPCTSQPLTSHCVVQTELRHISLCLQAAWISPREQSSENSQAVTPSTVKEARGQNAPFVSDVCEALCCFYKGGKQHSERRLGSPPHIPPHLLAGTLRF